MTLMKAAILTNYGAPEVIEVSEIKKPVPKEDQVLIKVHCATVTAGDCELRSFTMHPLFWLPLRLYMGVFKPRVKVIGQEFSGEVVEVGSEVTKYKVGDRVFCNTGIAFGSYAEYICIREKHPMTTVPKNFSMDESATIPTGGINSLHFLRMANIQRGQKVLINGAGGSIGTYGVQIAKDQGAVVTCVDKQSKLSMLSSIGSDHVIDYETEPVLTDQRYDVIFDVVGTISLQQGLNILNDGGYFLMANPSVGFMLGSTFRKWKTRIFGNKSGKRVIFQFSSDKTEDLEYLKELAEEGKLSPVIDKKYSLENLVDAHHYVDSGMKAGNVVINII